MSRRVSRLVVATTAVFAASACASATDVQTDLDVSLSLDRTLIGELQPVTITITIVNRGSQPAQAADPRGYACGRPYVVLNEAGENIELPGRACFAIAYEPIELSPGDSMKLIDVWSADQADGRGALPVAAGRYRIIARVFGENRTLESAPVWIRVFDLASTRIP